MSGKLLRRWKLWMVWQDGEMEQWFERQAAQGWHLVDTNSLSIHTFHRGPPADVAYRWDVTRSVLRTQYSSPEYVQLLEDAGWEHVSNASNWHCWRKPRSQGQATDIFTDTEGRVAKYKLTAYALLAVMGAGTAILLLAALVWPGALAKGMLIGGAIGGLTSGTVSLAALMQRIRQVRCQSRCQV